MPLRDYVRRNPAHVLPFLLAVLPTVLCSFVRPAFAEQACVAPPSGIVGWSPLDVPNGIVSAAADIAASKPVPIKIPRAIPSPSTGSVAYAARSLSTLTPGNRAEIGQASESPPKTTASSKRFCRRKCKLAVIVGIGVAALGGGLIASVSDQEERNWSSQCYGKGWGNPCRSGGLTGIAVGATAIVLGLTIEKEY